MPWAWTETISYKKSWEICKLNICFSICMILIVGSGTLCVLAFWELGNKSVQPTVDVKIKISALLNRRLNREMKSKLNVVVNFFHYIYNKWFVYSFACLYISVYVTASPGRRGDNHTVAGEHMSSAAQPEAVQRGETVPGREHSETERALPEKLRPLRVSSDPQWPGGLDLPGSHQTDGGSDTAYDRWVTGRGIRYSLW